MNKPILKIAFALVVLLSLVGCNIIPQTGSTGPLTASGTIQANSIRLAPEIGGRIKDIAGKEGDEVKAGQVIFRLDDAALLTQRQQAEAALRAAQAAQAAAQSTLDLTRAGATQDQLEAAQAQLDQASANLSAAQAALWDVEGATRPEDVAAAQARLDLARHAYYTLSAALSADQVDNVTGVLNQAQSGVSQMQDRRDRLANDTRTPPDALEAAASAISDTQTLVSYAKQAVELVQDNSQPLYQQLAVVRKTWQVAQLNLSQAQARQSALRAESDMPQAALDTAQAAVDEAQSLLTRSKQAYDTLNNSSQASRLQTAWTEMQNAERDFNALGHNPAGSGSLETMIHQLSALTAQRDVAQASYNTLKNGARPEQLAVVQAQLDAAKAKTGEAQAALDSIDVQIGKLTVAAPTNGTILNKNLNAGEIAPAGMTVVEMGNLDQVTLKVYVPEDQYGRIKPGQSVSVRVDSFPGRVFTGIVASIANQAEFTPRNVQTQDTRSTTVYAIEIHLPNPDHALKPGMPADAAF